MSALELGLRTVLIGVGATLIMDAWALLLRRFGVPSLDLALLGRWLGHLPDGRWRHDSIGAATPVRGEALLGWCAHYSIGITLAAVLLSLFGARWARSPSLLPALFVGIVTVVLPLFVLQPALGAGIASSRTARPLFNSVKSVVTHAVYGVGLYLAALAASALIPRDIVALVGRVLVAVALISLVESCGGSRGTGGAPGEIVVAEWPARLLDATCRARVACGRYSDEASCRATNAADLGPIPADLAKGIVAYDGAAAAACLQALEASGVLGHCRSSDKTTKVEPPSCFEVFVGTLAEGGACLVDEECRGGQCDRRACLDACCAGACLPGTGVEVPVGGACVSSVHCAHGAFCSFEGGAGGTCAPRAPAGTSCGSGDECAVGLVCGRTSLTSAAKSCTHAAGLGEACSGSCDDFETYCDPLTSRCTRQHGVGDACNPDAASCAFPGSCVVQPPGASGICAGPGQIRACAPPGYFCPRGLNCDAACSSDAVCPAT